MTTYIHWTCPVCGATNHMTVRYKVQLDQREDAIAFFACSNDGWGESGCSFVGREHDVETERKLFPPGNSTSYSGP